MCVASQILSLVNLNFKFPHKSKSSEFVNSIKTNSSNDQSRTRTCAVVVIIGLSVIGRDETGARQTHTSIDVFLIATLRLTC